MEQIITLSEHELRQAISDYLFRNFQLATSIKELTFEDNSILSLTVVMNPTPEEQK